MGLQPALAGLIVDIQDIFRQQTAQERFAVEADPPRIPTIQAHARAHRDRQTSPVDELQGRRMHLPHRQGGYDAGAARRTHELGLHQDLPVQAHRIGVDGDPAG